MQKNEDACIRYLMKEMDPSAEIEFERNMTKDVNLLIEVESLRKTYNKLGSLTKHVPPKELIELIQNHAISEQKKRIHKNRITSVLNIKYVASVAATLLLLITISSFFKDKNEDGLNHSSATNIKNSTLIDPWIDRNEVIEFMGISNTSNSISAFDTEFIQSMSRLTLVNSETGYLPPTKRVILTKKIK